MIQYTPISGIYVISNIKSGMVYIGQAQDIILRWKQHKYTLRKGKHGNRHLQFAWNKYGEKAFKFKILEYCSTEELDEREQHYLDIYMPKGVCYNISKDVQVTSRGIIRSSEFRAKLRNARLGTTASDETKHKMSLARTGKKHSKKHASPNDETRRKLSESHKVENLSEETRRKLSESHKAENLSEETRRKLSEAGKRRIRPLHSEESKKKMSESALKRPPVSDETRAKMSLSRKGKTHNENSKIKMSEIKKEWWQKRKEKDQADTTKLS